MVLWLIIAGGWTTQSSGVPAKPITVPNFNKYQVILDRQPFGRPPEAPSTATPPEAVKLALAEQALAKQIRLCAVTRTNQGIAAGLIDSSANPPKNHYLYVGDSADGITLVNADVDAETAEIEKDGASLTFTLTGIKTPAAVTPAITPRPLPVISTATPSAIPFRITPRPLVSPFAPNPGGVTTSNFSSATYLERLKKRREELQAQNAANLAGLNKTTETLVTEAARAAMRKRNMDMIRRGEGSLGIPLTAEEDAQLVKEGVLPAAQ